MKLFMAEEVYQILALYGGGVVWYPTRMKKNRYFRLCAVAALAAGAAAAADWHVDSAAGNDAADGTSPATAWRSLDRVNKATLAPGDRVLFKRGGLWRGTLSPVSGAPGKPVTYSWYGHGPKPIIQNSADRSKASDWFEESPGLWSTRIVEPVLHEQLWDGTSCEGWGDSWQEGVKGSLRRVTENGETFLRAICKVKPKQGAHLIQFWGPRKKNLPDSAILRLKVRSSKPFNLSRVNYTLVRHPWTQAMKGTPPRVTVGEDWQTLDVFFAKSGSVEEPALHFSIGDVLPEGATFDFVPVGLWRATLDAEAMLPFDVGIFICDHGKRWGVKKWRNPDWKVQELENQLDYWYDPEKRRVVVRFDRNPATAFSSIELAFTRHIINQNGRHDVVYDGLCVRYGAAHGFGGGSTRNITIRNCDICWIGGGLQFWRRNEKTGKIAYPVRFGNGIEVWGDAPGHLVERNRLWEIYDAALTNQGRNDTETDIVWRDNVIWNSEYSFEYWNAKLTANITFEHNTCVDAGSGWAHAQRPDRNGAHLMYYSNRAATTNFVVRNNIFCRATEWTARSALDWRYGLTHDHNLVWNDGAVPVFRWLEGKSRQMLDWPAYRALGFDPNGEFAAPKFVNPALRDYRLAPGSPGLTLASDGGPVGARDMPGLDGDQSLSPAK